MDELNFEKVTIVLAEPHGQVRTGLKSTLASLGIRNVKDVERLSQVRRLVEEGDLDLLISDIDLPDGDVSSLFYEIRHHSVGLNPFVPIIATSWASSVDNVRRVIDSGADDLLVKPISTGQLMDRVRALTNARKPFVVTTDYIGPDRRGPNSLQRGEDIPQIEVPNTLQHRATGKGDIDPVEFQKAIDTAVASINEQKMDRHAKQIVYLVERILPGPKRDMSKETLPELINRLLYVTEDLSRRMKGTRFGHIAELSKSLYKVAEKIKEAKGKPSAKDEKLMPQLALAIQASFKEGMDSAGMAQDISDSIEKAGSR
ncbi:MAG: response regulator [Rhodospirillaceae bacterium]|jgi:DNA-binding response OmpR family regulator|nr:response regulator [Rhodospirillaceae bacterium]MBT5373567.1 response regulator [Rhodospirillaceae bacterium]MBT5659361.1 response regulator [Rhodospirillaceae bacterium]MBT5751752.1 response regulator [Rhodospirillaceae bacterium]